MLLSWLGTPRVGDRRGLRLPALFALLVALMGTPDLRSGAPSAPSRCTGASGDSAAAAPLGLAAPASAGPALLAAAWWQKLYAPIETGLANRQRMIQFGALGMLLALAIIWWRR